jgi:hypothetical protein
MTNGKVGPVLLVVGCWATACAANDDTGTGAGGSATGGTATGGAGSGDAGVSGAGSGGTATGGAGAATGGTATGGAGTSGVGMGGTAAGGAGAAAGGGAGTSAATASGAGGGAASGGTGAATGGGAGTGGAADCFPPITDFAVRDGGFGAAQREVVELGTGDSVSLFRPSDAKFGQDGCRYPLLVWGNGSTNTVDIWASHLSRASSFGFIVVAPEQTQVNAGHMNAALDHVLRLSEDTSSGYFDKVDATKLGATAYSLGGAGAMQVASNVRIGATFIWDSFGNCSPLHGPLGTIVASDGIGGARHRRRLPSPGIRDGGSGDQSHVHPGLSRRIWRSGRANPLRSGRLRRLVQVAFHGRPCRASVVRGRVVRFLHERRHHRPQERHRLTRSLAEVTPAPAGTPRGSCAGSGGTPC